MTIAFEKSVDYFLYFIIFVKVVFALSAVGHFILIHLPTSAFNDLDNRLLFWKERTEFIFIASMSILLIYHFRPYKNVPTNKETSLLFYLFGWILLFTAKWSLFFKEAPWYKAFSKELDLK